MEGSMTLKFTAEQHAEIFRLIHDQSVMSALLMSTHKLHPYLEVEHQRSYAVWQSILEVLEAAAQR